jgi:hypothetical protein
MRSLGSGATFRITSTESPSRNSRRLAVDASSVPLQWSTRSALLQRSTPTISGPSSTVSLSRTPKPVADRPQPERVLLDTGAVIDLESIPWTRSLRGGDQFGHHGRTHSRTPRDEGSRGMEPASRSTATHRSGFDPLLFTTEAAEPVHRLVATPASEAADSQEPCPRSLVNAIEWDQGPLDSSPRRRRLVLLPQRPRDEEARHGRSRRRRS